VGDQLQTLQGNWRRVVAITPLPGQETVYNFTVAKDHDYFVGETGLLVHNAGGCGCGPKPPKNFLPPINPPQLPPIDIPPGWRIRSMGPVPWYPNGYWRMEKPMPNGGWQGINPATMRPGQQHETHVEYPPGTCPIP
jgi:hypothetical protein